MEDFGDYARLCFESFGDNVKFWITINEPETVTDDGYGDGDMAPGIKDQQGRRSRFVDAFRWQNINFAININS